MKIFLDDLRTPPDGWVLCRWPEEVIELLKTKKVTHLSLDHDLGDDDHGTGYDVLLWLEREVFLNPIFSSPIITVHSANTSAVQKMEAAIKSISRLTTIS